MRASRNEYELVPIEQAVTPAAVPLSNAAKKRLNRIRRARIAASWASALVPIGIAVVVWLMLALVIYLKWIKVS